jgi:arylsulfatase A-like enzyme
MGSSRRRLITCLAIALCSLVIAPSARSQPKPNILFIPIDDLKPIAGCYGGPAITPNLDKLASRGILFNRAYCQQALCSPSRSSLMTGRRPDATKVFDLETHFRKALPDVVTLSQHFKNNGYVAAAVGKIYHPGFDDEPSWSIPNKYKLGPTFGDPNLMEELKKERQARIAKGEKDPPLRGPSVEIADVPDEGLPDGKIANIAIELLRKNKDKSFFIAAGFLKPHLPFAAPRKYWDLYPPDSIKLPDNRTAPKDAPKQATHNSAELRQYTDIPKKQEPISDEKQKELIRGYLAATSYMDAQLGRVLNELDALGLRDRTIIVLWGDHGWHLGDHGLFCKHTNFEEATRSPLIISLPDPKNAGTKIDALVEFVDVYPTLCDLAALPQPEYLEGTSLIPLIENPQRQWKSAAFSQYPRGGEKNPLMGYSMRTDRYRYTEWQNKTGKAIAAELYDHHTDPNEMTNLGNVPEQKALVSNLSAQLKAGWQAARP